MTHPAPAPMGRRLLAYLVDQVAVVACGGGLLLGALLPAVRAATAGDSPGTEGPVTDPTTLLIGWGMLGALAVVQWWAQGERGWTVGKYLLGLRTVDVRSGRPVGMQRIFVRGLVVAAGTLVLGVGQLVVLASPLWDSSGRNRGWHDRSAGAEVVDLRTGTLPSARTITVITRSSGMWAIVPVTVCTVAAIRRIGSWGSTFQAVLRSVTG